MVKNCRIEEIDYIICKFDNPSRLDCFCIGIKRTEVT